MATLTRGAPPGGAPLSIRRLRGSRAGALGFYVFRRLLWLVPVLLFVTVITFVLMHLAPGGPFDREGRQLSETTLRNLNEKYGLDKPLVQQFWIYLWNALHLDFGDSIQYPGQKVSDLISRVWPTTVVLGVVAFCFITVCGIALGVLAALRQNTWIDYAAVGFATFGSSVPNLVIGIGLIIVLSVSMNRLTAGTFYLPTGGAFLTEDGIDPSKLVMPVLTLSVLPIAFLARLTRASTLDVLRQDFVRTAWAKGLRERIVVYKHILKNSLIPVVTFLGPLFAILVTGTIVVEQIFSLPGLGRTFFIAINSRDYSMILGLAVLSALIIALANLVVDVLYVFIDPRMRLT